MVCRKDVAERAGVSVAVVSYVLNNRSMIKKEMRRKVLAAVQELGYWPNQTVRSLKTKKTGQIAVLVHFLANPFEAGLLLYRSDGKALRIFGRVSYFRSGAGRRIEEQPDGASGRHSAFGAGAAAAQMLLALIEGGGAESRMLQGSLVARGSTV